MVRATKCWKFEADCHRDISSNRDDDNDEVIYNGSSDGDSFRCHLKIDNVDDSIAYLL